MKELVSTLMLIEVNADCSQEVAVDGYVHYHVENDYGADADGNRGVQRVFIDDITDLGATTEDGDDVELTPEYEKKAYRKITEKFLEG